MRQFNFAKLLEVARFQVKVAQNPKCCQNVAEHNLSVPHTETNKNKSCILLMKAAFVNIFNMGIPKRFFEHSSVATYTSESSTCNTVLIGIFHGL